MTSSTSPKIAILGGGPSGLTLASLLSANNINYTLFELRPSPTPHTLSQPSGSLDLHQESGLLALSACNLLPAFHALKAECSEAMIIADRTGKVEWGDDGSGNRPEISRNNLTSLLLSSIPGERIRWDHKILAVTKTRDSTKKWTVRFSSPFSALGQAEQEKEEDFDLIIGADGAWSRVRRLLTPENPFYSSISCLTFTIPYLCTTYPELAKLVGAGSFTAMGDGKAVMSQRGSMESARIYVMLRTPSETYLQESGIAALVSSPPALKTRLLGDESLFASWGAGIKDLLAAACDAHLPTSTSAPGHENGEGGSEKEGITAKPLYMLPTTHTWHHVLGLTLVGDAAHLMTPFAGEGVNCGMLDALELSQAILSSFTPSTTSDSEASTLDDRIEGFEKKMWERMHPLQEETLANLKMMFEDADAPRGFVEWMRSMFESMGEGGPEKH